MNPSLRSNGSRPGTRWRCIDSGGHDGRFNMDYDLQLVGEFRQTGIPILRFYYWDPFCISLGRNQSLSDIDLRLARQDGIGVIKRPTGGKAVLHAEEMTYSVIMEAAGMSVRESYNLISRALVTGLRLLGADLELSRSSADFRKLFHDPSTIPCFSTSALHEVEFRGRKLVGSAQHRFGDVLLQHGSILTGNYHKRIVRYLEIDDELKDKTARDLDNHTITLGEIIGGGTARDAIRTAVERGFEEIFGADFACVTERLSNTGEVLHSQISRQSANG